MVNVFARYPGETIQPYVGAGFGPSFGLSSDANIQASSTQLTGTSISAAIAYQFLDGIHAM